MTCTRKFPGTYQKSVILHCLPIQIGWYAGTLVRYQTVPRCSRPTTRADAMARGCGSRLVAHSSPRRVSDERATDDGRDVGDHGTCTCAKEEDEDEDEDEDDTRTRAG